MWNVLRGTDRGTARTAPVTVHYITALSFYLFLSLISFLILSPFLDFSSIIFTSFHLLDMTYSPAIIMPHTTLQGTTPLHLHLEMRCHARKEEGKLKIL